MAAIYYTDDAGNEVKFEIPPGATDVSIGRGANNSLRIRKPSISRKHATIALGDGGVSLMDLGSSNGSYIDGQRLTPNVAHPLSGGEALKCGEIHLRFEADVSAPAPPPPMPSIPQVAHMPAEQAPPPPPLGDASVNTFEPTMAADEPVAPALDDPMAGFDAPPAPNDDVLAGFDLPGDPAVDGGDVLDGLFDDPGVPAGEPPDLLAGLAEPSTTAEPDPLAETAAPPEPLLGDESPVAPDPSAEPPPEPEPTPEDDGVYVQQEKSAIVMAIGLAEAELFGDEDAVGTGDEAPAPLPPLPLADDILSEGADDDSPMFEPDPIPDLPDDPASRATILLDLANKYRDDLASKSRRLTSLQKAARREVDTKKRLQEEKATADEATEEARRNLERATTERDTLREDVDRLNGLLQAGEAGVAEIEASLQETRQELDITKADRDDYERTAAKLQAEVDDRPTHEEMDAVRERLAGRESQLELVASERDSLTGRAERADGFEKQVSDLESENKQLLRALDEAPTPGRYKEMELELRALRRETSSGSGRSVMLEKQLKEQEKKLKNFKTKVRRTFDELASTLKQLESDKMKIEGRLADAEGTISEDEERLANAASHTDEAQHDKTELEGQVQRLEDDLAVVKESRDEQKQRAREAESRAREMEGAIERLTEDATGSADEAKQRLAELETEHAAAKADLEEIRTANADKDQNIEDLQSAAAAAEEGRGSEVEGLQDAKAALDDRVAELEAQIATAATAGDAAAEDIAAAQKKAEEAAAEARAAQEAHDETKAQVEALQQAGESAAGDADATQADLERLATELADKTKDLDNALQDKAGLEGTVEALQAAADDGDSQAEMERLATELADKTKDLDNALQDKAGLEGTVEALQAATGGSDTAAVTELVDKLNDVVSNWKNSFMHLGNFLLDVRNGVDLLREPGADSATAIEEMESSGTAEEMQELLQRCEDDSRALKKELRSFVEDHLN